MCSNLKVLGLVSLLLFCTTNVGAFSASSSSAHQPHISPSPQDLQGSMFDELTQPTSQKKQRRAVPKARQDLVQPSPQDLRGSMFDEVQRNYRTATRQPQQIEIPIQRPATFVSPPFRCYIEDTDGNGKMADANYLQAYDRALHSMFMVHNNNLESVLETCTNMMPDGADIGGLKRDKTDGSSVMAGTYSDWSIVSVERQQFRVAPQLGQAYWVHGTLVEQPKEDKEVWDCALRESPNPNSPVFNAARVTIARPGTFVPPDTIVADYGIENEDHVTSTKEVFWYDNGQLYDLSLRNVMKLFERSRANFMGGPESLERLQDEHGLVFVITAINDMCKFPTSTKKTKTNRMDPEQLVIIQTDFEVQRQGAILECRQTLLADDQPVAQAKVTLMTLDAETYEPSTELPEWLRDIFIYGPQVAPVQHLSFRQGIPQISPAELPGFTNTADQQPRRLASADSNFADDNSEGQGAFDTTEDGYYYYGEGPYHSNGAHC